MATDSFPKLAQVLLIIAASVWAQADDGAVSPVDIPRLDQLNTGENVVAVVVHLEKPMPLATLAAMQIEVARMMRPTGLEFQWQQHSDQLASGAFPYVVFAQFSGTDYAWSGAAPYVVVARFSGTCEIPGPARSDGSSSALGRTYVSDGRSTSFCDVDCDRVGNFIQEKTSYADTLARQRLLGTALGRVLVHEMYHILADTREHGRNGISRAGVKPWELVGPHTNLDPKDVEAIQRRLSRPIGVGVVSPESR